MELTNRQWEKLLHHITVEVLALRQAGRILDDICNARQKTDNPHKTRTATIRRGNGQPGVTLKIDEGVEKAIPATEDTTEESADLLAPEEQALTQEVYAAVGGDDLAQYTTSIQWMDMRLADPQIKLAVSAWYILMVAIVLELTSSSFRLSNEQCNCLASAFRIMPCPTPPR